MKVGIFGGSFNPPHMGHLNSLQTVAKKAGLDQVRLVPTSQNPLKVPTEGPTPQQRLEMTKLAVMDWGPQFVVDDQEVVRAGKSYTIDTIQSLRKTIPAEDLYLIIGMDQFDELEQWKDVESLLKETNLIVTSRPGYDFPADVESLPKYLQKLVEEFDFNFIELKTGRDVQFIQLKDVEISATELRKWIRIGKSVEKYIPLSVETYIKTHKLYQHLGAKIGDYQKFTDFCAQVLFAKKGIMVKGFDLRAMSAPSEFALVASGTSTRHATALAENVIRSVKEEYNVHPLSHEGMDEGRWIAIDYGQLIIHIFYDFVRQEYSLENLWKEAVDLKLVDQSLKKD
ncbi:MAG: hypothetical protein BroJett040_08760 [Oligoflexia bacterium]|nr:MAG: hypothetical protein BroJett040_08760 [Oligoflexia bacterium]